jgi:hypothetical protein
MAAKHKVSAPVKLGNGGKTPLGEVWNGTPKAPNRPTNTANGTPTPVRPGMGATRSREWYARYD